MKTFGLLKFNKEHNQWYGFVCIEEKLQDVDPEKSTIISYRAHPNVDTVKSMLSTNYPGIILTEVSSHVRNYRDSKA